MQVIAAAILASSGALTAAAVGGTFAVGAFGVAVLDSSFYRLGNCCS